MGADSGKWFVCLFQMRASPPRDPTSTQLYCTVVTVCVSCPTRANLGVTIPEILIQLKVRGPNLGYGSSDSERLVAIEGYVQ